MNSKTKKLTAYALLIAVMIIMSFTPLGYIRFLAVEITLMSIPVIAGVFFSGFRGGTLLGLVFGITSFVQCFGMSAFGTAIFGINPFFAFITCIIPRVLTGLISGVCFDLLKKSRIKSYVSYGIISALTPLLNTVLFVSCLLGFFGKSEYILNMMSSLGTQTVPAFISAAFGLNAVLEILVAVLVGIPMCKALEKIKK